ncbi:hypothetical protein EMCG_00536 [[Emmonsia] crescens]|uniref:Uncharacterized protein n=1 Tax=[Emmonsia] crescens TaxID=73230 RepID=A0A0G2HU17_9EURO|nr:hypothetical protein EMCG_00536 [Emmonsia crescens UAMH 3008]
MADNSSPDYEALYRKAEAERRQAEERVSMGTFHYWKKDKVSDMSNNEHDDEEDNGDANLPTAPQSTNEKEPIERLRAAQPTKTNPVKTGEGPVKEHEPTVEKDDETGPTKTDDLIDECEREQGAELRGNDLRKGPESPEEDL